MVINMEYNTMVNDDKEVMLINDFKLRWYTLVSRVDAAPTVDELVLTSLNSIANMLISQKLEDGEFDVLFELAVNLELFETIFQWNFLFVGADLEAFKAKELSFYDTLINSNGKRYLQQSTFAIPLMATLHHCSIRSSLAVERVLVQVLNSVCAALCSKFTDSNNAVKNHLNGIDLLQSVRKSMDESETPSMTEKSIFKQLCMGVLDAHEEASQPGETIDWTMTTASPLGAESSIQDRLPTFDSIFDILVPFVYREGELGWQARDALLLAMSCSLKDEEFSCNVALHSSVCQILATGLAVVYAGLPHRLVDNNLPSSWPDLMDAMERAEADGTPFMEFVDSLEFCQSILEVAHPLIQSSLLHYIHSGFFVSVLGFSLTQSSAEEVVTATVFLEKLLIRTAGSSLLPALLRFLLTEMPADNFQTFDTNPVTTNGASPTSPSKVDLYHSADDAIENHTENHPKSSRTYVELLITRLHYCNTLLGVATLSLFNTLLSLNCEDIMFYLVLRYLVPFRDALFSAGWAWPDTMTFSNASNAFLDLISPYSNCKQENIDLNNASPSTDPQLNKSKGVAELNLDDEVDGERRDEWMNRSSPLENETNFFSLNGKRHAALPHDSAGILDALVPLDLQCISTKSSMQVASESPIRVACVHRDGAHIRLTLHDTLAISESGSNDWLSYTNWAKNLIDDRTSACHNWRLAFDSMQPIASQLNALEAQITYDEPRNVDEVSIPERFALPEYGQEYKSKNLAVFHSRFKYFNNRVSSLKEAGEQTALALRKAAMNLDIEADFSLEAAEFSPVTTCETTLVESKGSDDQQTCINNQEEYSKSVRDVVKTGPHHLQNGSVVPKVSSSADTGSNSLDFVELESKEARVEDCRQTSALNDYDFNIPISTNCNANNSEIKSWYRFNYSDSDLGTSTEENSLPESDSNQQELTNSNCQIVPLYDAKVKKIAEEQTVDHFMKHSVEQLVEASKSPELENFINCLDNFTNFSNTEARDSEELDGCDGYSDYLDDLLERMENTGRSAFSKASDAGTKTPQNIKSDNVEDFNHGIRTGSCSTVRPSSMHSITSIPQSHSENRMPLSAAVARAMFCQTRQTNGYSFSMDLEQPNSSRSSSFLLENKARTSYNLRLSLDSRLRDRGSEDRTSELSAENFHPPSLGPFLSTLLERLENMPYNSFYANLYLTSLLSNLAAYPQPLLRAIMFLYQTPNGSSPDLRNDLLSTAYSQLIYNALFSIRSKMDRFAVNYASKPLGNSHVSFIDLVTDAKLYFQNVSEVRRALERNKSVQTGVSMKNGTLQFTDQNPRKQSFFTRLFGSRKHKTTAPSEPSHSIHQNAPNYPSAPNGPMFIGIENNLLNGYKWSHYAWLPESGTYWETKGTPKGNRLTRRFSRRSSRLKQTIMYHNEETVNWSNTQRMVLCAVVFEEFCKELAALSIEHSIRC